MFTGWVDQNRSDFQKVRSLAIRAAKMALETQGFTLPEPIYRLRFDERGLQLAESLRRPSAGDPASAAEPQDKTPAVQATNQALDVSPDRFLEAKVNDERSQAPEADLLDSGKPVE
jgi:hypothetical protein